jgi:hypothetical protein
MPLSIATKRTNEIDFELESGDERQRAMSHYVTFSKLNR